MFEFDKFVYHPLYILLLTIVYVLAIPLNFMAGNWIIATVLLAMQIPWLLRGITDNIFTTYTVDMFYKIIRME
jgi:hypothetical protein